MKLELGIYKSKKNEGFCIEIMNHELAETYIEPNGQKTNNLNKQKYSENPEILTVPFNQVDFIDSNNLQQFSDFQIKELKEISIILLEKEKNFSTSSANLLLDKNNQIELLTQLREVNEKGCALLYRNSSDAYDNNDFSIWQPSAVAWGMITGRSYKLNTQDGKQLDLFLMDFDGQLKGVYGCLEANPWGRCPNTNVELLRVISLAPTNERMQGACAGRYLDRNCLDSILKTQLKLLAG